MVNSSERKWMIAHNFCAFFLFAEWSFSLSFSLSIFLISYLFVKISLVLKSKYHHSFSIFNVIVGVVFLSSNVMRPAKILILTIFTINFKFSFVCSQCSSFFSSSYLVNRSFHSRFYYLALYINKSIFWTKGNVYFNFSTRTKYNRMFHLGHFFPLSKTNLLGGIKNTGKKGCIQLVNFIQVWSVSFFAFDVFFFRFSVFALFFSFVRYIQKIPIVIDDIGKFVSMQEHVHNRMENDYWGLWIRKIHTEIK